MTFYRRGGAKVFAAGVLNFAKRAGTRIGDTMIADIFAKLEVR
jgi:hypothetical protein